MSNSSSGIIIGRKPVLDALRGGSSLAGIWIDRTMKGPEEIDIRTIAREKGIPLKRVSKTVLNQKTRANHQGVLAYTAPITFHDPETVISHLYSQGKVPFILYLDRIQDVGNLGSIIRTAEVMGVHAIVIPSQKMAVINDQVVKISAGAIRYIPICRISQVGEAMQLFHNLGLKIIASDLNASRKITETDMTVPLCCVIGSEDTGISDLVRDAADDLFLIPQAGKTESLNAAVATGMILFEAFRQRESGQ